MNKMLFLVSFFAVLNSSICLASAPGKNGKQSEGAAKPANAQAAAAQSSTQNSQIASLNSAAGGAPSPAPSQRVDLAAGKDKKLAEEGKPLALSAAQSAPAAQTAAAAAGQGAVAAAASQLLARRTIKSLGRILFQLPEDGDECSAEQSIYGKDEETPRDYESAVLTHPTIGNCKVFYATLDSNQKYHVEAQTPPFYKAHYCEHGGTVNHKHFDPML